MERTRVILWELVGFRHQCDVPAEPQARELICPTGKKTSRAKICPALHAKIFRFAIAPNHTYSFRRPVPARGAARDRHGRWARDAMDAAASGAIIARTNDAATYGEVVWSWRSDAGAKVVKTL
jgi:hypothetical protein